MPLHLTLGEQNGHGWICMKMEGSGYKQSLVCAKNSPWAMWVYHVSMSEAMASLRRSTAWSSAMQLVEGDGLKDLTTSR